MKVSNEFSQPINPIGGTYPTSWAGYVHKQPRTAEGLPNSRHIGDDYNGPGGGNTDLGFDVSAVANGVVEKVIPWNKKAGYGNHLFIKHELTPYLQKKYGCKIIYSHYAHLESFRCFEGQEVSKGQVIAKLGNTGTKYAHLHLEIRKPTGRGYEDYPTNQSVDWIDKYYFTPFTFIEENKKELTEQAPTTSPEPEATIETEPSVVPESPPDDDSGVTSPSGTGDSETSSTNEPDNGSDTTSDVVVFPPDVLVDIPPETPSKIPNLFQKIKDIFDSALDWFLSFFIKKEVR